MSDISIKLQRLRETFHRVAQYANVIPPALVTLKPSQVAFCANEIIYHLLEVEELWQRRLHQLLHSNDNTFQQIDPDQLAKDHAYNDKPYEEGIAKWKAAREKTIQMVESMTEQEQKKVGVHSRFGEMDTHRILDIMADHDLQHLSQLKRTVKQVQQ